MKNLALCSAALLFPLSAVAVAPLARAEEAKTSSYARVAIADDIKTVITRMKAAKAARQGDGNLRLQYPIRNDAGTLR